MALTTERLAAAFFDNTKQAEEAIAALRLAGFAQIGVASRDDSRERKLAEKTDTRTGVAASPDAGGVLQRDDGESDYADLEDVHGALLGAHLSAHEAAYFRDQLEHAGVLVTVQAPASQWPQARRTLEECGGDSGTEIPDGDAHLDQETTTVITPAPPPPLQPPQAHSQARVESTIPNPAQQGTVTIKREPGTPQSDFELSRGMAPIELRGTLRDAHRERMAEKRKIA